MGGEKEVTMIDINTAIFLAKDRQQTWLARAARARLAREARAARKEIMSPARGLFHLSLRRHSEAARREQHVPARQLCATCG